MTETTETLDQKLDRLDATTAELTEAVKHAATKRSTLALAVAVVALTAIIVGGTVQRSIGRHGDCEQGNEVRAAILVTTQTTTDAVINALLEVFTAGRTEETYVRAKAAAEAMRRSINSNPALVEARTDLQPRECSYLPF